MTTTGDTIYSSSGSTPARLGIGSTGQVLTVSGGLPTWATPGGAGANWSLLNAGGTNLTGATTVTVSGISGKDKIMVIVDNTSMATSGSFLSIQFNSDTGSNYGTFGMELSSPASYAATNLGTYTQPTGSSIQLARLATTSADEVITAYLNVTGCNASGVKVFNGAGAGSGGSNQRGYVVGGIYNSSSTISSVSAVSSGGNFDGGKIYVYTSA